MAVVLLAFGVGDILAILLVLFVPGYVLTASLFPGAVATEAPGINWTERIALSVGLSIAVVPLLGILLNFSPWGIRFAPVVVAITLFTVGVGYVAFRRRMHLPPAQRLSLSIDLGTVRWHEHNTIDKGLTFALVSSIIIACGTLAYVFLTPLPAEKFTEFYVLGPGGNISNYPTDLNVSQIGSVIIGLTNHEGKTVNYGVIVNLVGVQVVRNATSGFNESVDVNWTRWNWINTTVEVAATWLQPYTFSIQITGLWKVQFLLFKNGDLSSAYREVHLFVLVR